MTFQQVYEAANRRIVPRQPFAIGRRVVGSVALAHQPLLRELPPGLCLGDDAVKLEVSAAQRDAWFAEANARLRHAGAIKAWRDETYAVVDPARPGRPLARIERAASRFWGTLTFGAHANGFVADAAGRPQRLWIARRSPHKPTDPGRLDNLVGGGVPHDQTPRQALLREAWEEAGLPPKLAAHARFGGIVTLHCDIAEGLQHEQLHGFDLPLPSDFVPRNQDGEVAEFRCWPIDELLAQAPWHEMTLDAALVTLDFLRRQGLLGAAA